MGENAGIRALVIMSLCPLPAHTFSSPLKPGVPKRNYAQSHKTMKLASELWRSPGPASPSKANLISKLDPTPKLDHVDQGHNPMFNLWRHLEKYNWVRGSPQGMGAGLLQFSDHLYNGQYGLKSKKYL